MGDGGGGGGGFGVAAKIDFDSFFYSEELAQIVCCGGDPLPKLILTLFILGAKTKVKNLPKLHRVGI